MEGWHWLQQTGEETPQRLKGAVGLVAWLELRTGMLKPGQRLQQSEVWPLRRRRWRMSLAEVVLGAESV